MNPRRPLQPRLRARSPGERGVQPRADAHPVTKTQEVMRQPHRRDGMPGTWPPCQHRCRRAAADPSTEGFGVVPDPDFPIAPRVRDALRTGESWPAGQGSGRFPRMKACIIGAGSSGIAAAQVLQARGIDFDCFEKGSQVGGNWRYENDNGMSSAYRSLHINTSRRVMAFKSLPMPEGYPGLSRPLPDGRLLRRSRRPLPAARADPVRHRGASVEPVDGARGSGT